MRKFSLIATVVAAGILLSGCAVAQSYVDKGVEKLSADNVEKEYTLVIRDWQALTQSADNACGAQASNTSNDSPTLVEDPAFAYKATYRKVVASYNARQTNIFQADLVGPPGYPREIPSTLIGGTEADFCLISTELVTLKVQAEG